MIQFEQATKFKPPVPAWVYEARLLARAEVDDNGCWLWMGPRLPAGYGASVRAWGKGWLAHRLAYATMVGPIGTGRQIDHTCRVTSCINPEHLESVTQAENLRRQGAAVTHCPRDHEYTAANTYRSPSGRGGRICKACIKVRRDAS